MWKHYGGFCFGAADSGDEAKARRANISPKERRHSQRRPHFCVVPKIPRSSASCASLNRSEKERKESNRSLARKGFGSSDDDDRRAASIFSSSSASSASSSSSSSSSRLSLAALKVLPEPRKPLPGPVSTCGSPTRTLLLVASLSVLVFFGRLCAIVWTSSWLFFVTCRSYDVGAAAAATKEVECTLAKLRRRWVKEAAEKKRVILQGLLQRNQRIVINKNPKKI